jgi:hypothetical protein
MTRSFFLVVLVLSVSSCGMTAKKQPLPPSPPEWRFEKNAIILHLKVDPNANLYDGNSTLRCASINLQSERVQQLRGNPDGLSKLLSATFDASVAQSRKWCFIRVRNGPNRRPGRRAKYVGIVAGYFNLHEERVVRLLLIPVKVEQRHRALPWFRRSYIKIFILASRNSKSSEETLNQTLFWHRACSATSAPPVA